MAFGRNERVRALLIISFPLLHLLQKVVEKRDPCGISKTQILCIVMADGPRGGLGRWERTQVPLQGQGSLG